MEYQYLSISQYNDGSDDVPLVLENNRGTNMLDVAKSYYMTVLKFYIDNSRIPCFIPTILPPGTQFNPYTVFPCGAQSWNYAGINQPTIVPFSQSNLMTDLSLAIGVLGVNPVPHTLDVYASQVGWIPQNPTSVFNNDYSRTGVVNNPYFHCYNSIHIMDLIVTALNNCALAANLFQVENNDYFQILKQGSGASASYSLLFDKRFFTYDAFAFNKVFRIFFNKSLADMFGFHTVPSNILPGFCELVIDPNFVSSFNTYSFITELNRPINTIFPFNKLLLTSDNIQVEPLNYYLKSVNNLTNQNNPLMSIITDFDLNIADVDSFYNCITYQAPNSDRKIMLQSQANRNYTVNCYVQTPDGHICNISLKPKGFANIYLQFIETN